MHGSVIFGFACLMLEEFSVFRKHIFVYFQMGGGREIQFVQHLMSDTLVGWAFLVENYGQKSVGSRN